MTVYTPASPQCPKCGQQRELVCPKCHWDEVLILRERLARMEQRTCGNCRDGVEMGFVGGNTWACDSERSACAIVGRRWPADHGCPSHRPKDAQ